MDLKLADFVGNEALVKLLRRGELPPSSLFSGPSGVGKRTLAILLAGLANCDHATDRELCGRCPSCFQLRGVDDPRVEEARSHPDVLVADSAWVAAVVKKHGRKPNPMVISVDATREITRLAQYRPFQGRCRFFIIDEAEKMTESAQNSLLKTLEESPDTTRLILIAAFPDRLLPTIHSRCQRFNFRPLEGSELAHYLVRREICEKEEAGLIAAFSLGSLGTALQLDLQATIQDRDRMLRLLEDWIQNPTFEGIFRFCEGAAIRAELKDRERAQQLLGYLELLAQDLYLLLAGSPERVTSKDVLQRLKPLAEAVTLEWLDRFIYHVKEAQRDISGYVSPLICLETLWLEMENRDAGSG